MRGGVSLGSGRSSLGSGVFRVADQESSRAGESVRDAEESTEGRGVPGEEEESPEGSASWKSSRHVGEGKVVGQVISEWVVGLFSLVGLNRVRLGDSCRNVLPIRSWNKG